MDYWHTYWHTFFLFWLIIYTFISIFALILFLTLFLNLFQLNYIFTHFHTFILFWLFLHTFFSQFGNFFFGKIIFEKNFEKIKKKNGIFIFVLLVPWTTIYKITTLKRLRRFTLRKRFYKNSYQGSDWYVPAPCWYVPALHWKLFLYRGYGV